MKLTVTWSGRRARAVCDVLDAAGTGRALARIRAALEKYTETAGPDTPAVLRLSASQRQLNELDGTLRCWLAATAPERGYLVPQETEGRRAHVLAALQEIRLDRAVRAAATGNRNGRGDA